MVAAVVRDDALGALERIALALDATTLADDVRAVAERIDERRFYVAVLGQFKRGKSTLINALAGQPLLPTGVAPVTSVVTIVKHGPRVAARVRSRAAGWEPWAPEDLAAIVAEQGNPANTRGIVAVEVEVPSALLAHGLCLVDTPGLGSVNEANSHETREFLPHVDAALLVVGADPPINGEEAQLLVQLGASVRDLFIVLAKADRVSPEEMADARAFTQRVLEQSLPGRTLPVFEVSAKQTIDDGAASRDWERLEASLRELAQGAGAQLVESARQREIDALTRALTRYLDEAEGALRRPVAETEVRLASLRLGSDEAARATHELRHLFDAGHKQIERRLERERTTFLSTAYPPLAAELRAEGTRAELLAHAQELCERRTRAWRDELRSGVELEFSATAERFVTAAGAVTRVIRAATPDSGLPEALSLDTSLHARSRYHFTPLNVEASPGMWRGLADRLRGEASTLRSSREHADQFLLRLLDVNARGIVGDYIDRIVESRRGIERAIREAFEQAATAATRAATSAATVRERGEAAIATELARLARLRQDLAAITT